MASSVPNAGTALEQAKIAGVRQAWMQTVRDADANRGGKADLKALLQHVFGLYDVERKILSSRVATRNQLAIELDEMESTVTPVSSGMEIHAHVKRRL
jgi:hypothetical protein